MKTWTISLSTDWEDKGDEKDDQARKLFKEKADELYTMMLLMSGRRRPKVKVTVYDPLEGVEDIPLEVTDGAD